MPAFDARALLNFRVEEKFCSHRALLILEVRDRVGPEIVEAHAVGPQDGQNGDTEKHRTTNCFANRLLLVDADIIATLEESQSGRYATGAAANYGDPLARAPETGRH